MKQYYYLYNEDRGSYSIRRREPNSPSGYVHLRFEYSLNDARQEVKLLNRAAQEHKTNR